MSYHHPALITKLTNNESYSSSASEDDSYPNSAKSSNSDCLEISICKNHQSKKKVSWSELSEIHIIEPFVEVQTPYIKRSSNFLEKFRKLKKLFKQ
jgi:hypothetical protein